MDPYYRAVARSVGVPPMFLEDACQDIAIAVWLADDARKIVIRRTAIDAARHYGTHDRGRVKPETVELTAAVDIVVRDDVATLDNVLDFRTAVRRLRRNERRLIERRIAGVSLAPIEEQNLTEARRQLRSLLTTGKTCRHQILCRFCRRRFRATSLQAQFCSEACNKKAKKGLTLEDYRKVCANERCRQPFTARFVDARYCCARCYRAQLARDRRRAA